MTNGVMVKLILNGATSENRIRKSTHEQKKTSLRSKRTSWKLIHNEPIRNKKAAF